MTKNSDNNAEGGDGGNFRVTFVGKDSGEKAPEFAVYHVDTVGRPVKKIGRFDGENLNVDLASLDKVAFGPDVEDPSQLPQESLTTYRVADRIESWRNQGVLLPRIIWDRFYFNYTCVTGTVRKCRPWYWRILENPKFSTLVDLVQAARIKPITAELQPHILYPLSCQPICDGIVEIYERECCCHHIHIPDLLDRLRDILDVLPIPLPDPPGPVPERFPSPPLDRLRVSSLRSGAPELKLNLQRNKARSIQRSSDAISPNAIPPEELYEDYQALVSMPADHAQEYVLARPYLIAIFCHCSVRKVGQTAIQPGGKFDFCYLTNRFYALHVHCTRTYAYVVKQLINGVLTVVYDGLSAPQYFSASAPADIRSYNPNARICADPGNPPPNDGNPFVMLEHIGSFGTFHFNFPVQNGVSQVANLDANDGSYTTGYAPDCPWGGALGLRLWFSPELASTVQYYRLSVVAVNNNGTASGTPTVLNSSVTWDKLVDVPGDTVRVPETLGPVPVGSENHLFRVPYWSSPDHRYLSGQFHQVWNTALADFPDGKYMLLLEVFDGAGNKIKPNGAAGPGNAQNFLFRRWASSSNTDPVPYADVAHVFWVDNTPVGGDIVDLRQNHVPNIAECQFMTGSESDTFAIGFRAYHVNGVQHAGNGDQNSFMWHYNISWQRGLNGPSGPLGFAPSELNNHTDVGETGAAVSSGTESFGVLLGPPPIKPKCTFSVRLRVFAKHFTGSSRILDYDFTETASFALEIQQEE